MVKSTIRKLKSANKALLSPYASQVIVNTKKINNTLKVKRDILLTKVLVYKNKINREKRFFEELEKLETNLIKSNSEYITAVEITTKSDVNILVYLDSNLHSILGILQTNTPSIKVFSRAELLQFGSLERLKDFQVSFSENNVFWFLKRQSELFSLKLWITGYIEYSKTNESKIGTDLYRVAITTFVETKAEFEEFLNSINLD